MPSTVTFSDGSTITYSYAADGTKLRTVHIISGTSTQKDYCANVLYENGVQKLLLTEEGYVDLSNSSYYYYLKDHQGNNRVVVSSGGTVAEVNHYYPFGGVFASSGNVQPYKYNGKELDTKKDLNWYDYGARHYDAALGRWFVVDPLAEKMSAWSPYAYCFNSPVRYIDPDGEIGQVAAGAIIGGVIGGGWALLQGKSFGEVAAATVGGAVDGAITASGAGLFAKFASFASKAKFINVSKKALTDMIGGVVGSSSGNLAEQGINVVSGNQTEFNASELMVSGALGAVGGYASYKNEEIVKEAEQLIEIKYSSSSVRDAIAEEIKSEFARAGRELGHSTKRTVNNMTQQRIAISKELERTELKGISNLTEKGTGVVLTVSGTVITEILDERH